MTREQIIAGLDCMSRYTCEGCPNYTDRNCPEDMTPEIAQAALELLKDDEKLIADYQRWHENQKNTIKELLKAQEPVEPVFERQFMTSIEIYDCGKCGTSLGAKGIAKYCMKCGQAVKWE